MEIEILQITQEQIDDQNKDYDEGYLANIKAGDYVYDDGEVLCSQYCIELCYQASNDKKEQEKYFKILQRISSVNTQ